jgi:hypothetical protein
MVVPQLSDEQLEIVRKFMESDAASTLFTQLEANCIAGWIICDDPVDRETAWRDLQAILNLKNSLRDSAAMKRLNERNQEARRAYTT